LQTKKAINLARPTQSGPDYLERTRIGLWLPRLLEKKLHRHASGWCLQPKMFNSKESLTSPQPIAWILRRLEILDEDTVVEALYSLVVAASKRNENFSAWMPLATAAR
jgi:hypothetical protein